MLWSSRSCEEPGEAELLRQPQHPVPQPQWAVPSGDSRTPPISRMRSRTTSRRASEGLLSQEVVQPQHQATVRCVRSGLVYQLYDRILSSRCSSKGTHKMFPKQINSQLIFFLIGEAIHSQLRENNKSLSD